MADAIPATLKNEENKREEIWKNKLKPAKNNRVVLLELEKWLKTLIVKNFQESRLQIKGAYTFVKTQISQRGALGIDYIERPELRAFLVALKIRFEILEFFKKEISGQKQNEPVDVNDFIGNKKIIEKWTKPMPIPVKAFDPLKKNGVVYFNEMCDWACKLNYDKEGDKL